MLEDKVVKATSRQRVRNGISMRSNPQLSVGRFDDGACGFVVDHRLAGYKDSIGATKNLWFDGLS